MTVVLLAPGAIGNVEIVVAIEIRGKDLESRDSGSGVRISCPDCLYIKHEAVRRAAGRRPSTVEHPVLSRLTGFEDCSQQVSVCKNERQTAVGKKSRTPSRGVTWSVVRQTQKGFLQSWASVVAASRGLITDPAISRRNSAQDADAALGAGCTFVSEVFAQSNYRATRRLLRASTPEASASARNTTASSASCALPSSASNQK